MSLFVTNDAFVQASLVKKGKMKQNVHSFQQRTEIRV